MKSSEAARLVRFVGGLAVKRWLRPAQHVRPVVAELFLTDNCNLRCVTCACWREDTKNELTTEEWRDVLRQLAAFPIHKVNFTGGEPLIRKDAIELMGYARDVGIRHLHLNTNAVRLTNDRRSRILAAGVRSFNVSVDGPDASTHDAVRGRRGAFETTLRHLAALIDERERYALKIRMNFTVMRDNASRLPEVVELAQRLGVRLYLNVATDKTFLFRADEVSPSTIVPEGEIVEAFARVEEMARRDRRYIPRYSDLAYVPRHFREPLQPSLPCAESQLKLMIHSRGEIGGCWGHDAQHTVREVAIADVIASDQYREEHARLYRKQCVGCGSNYSLNLRLQPSSYLHDAAWRLGRRSLAGR